MVVGSDDKRKIEKAEKAAKWKLQEGKQKEGVVRKDVAGPVRETLPALLPKSPLCGAQGWRQWGGQR